MGGRDRAQYGVCQKGSVSGELRVQSSFISFLYLTLSPPKVLTNNNLSKDARLPVQLQRAMAAEAEAAREARAKVR